MRGFPEWKIVSIYPSNGSQRSTAYPEFHQLWSRSGGLEMQEFAGVQASGRLHKEKHGIKHA